MILCMYVLNYQMYKDQDYSIYLNYSIYYYK